MTHTILSDLPCHAIVGDFFYAILVDFLSCNCYKLQSMKVLLYFLERWESISQGLQP